jgi:hypothetical protein
MTKKSYLLINIIFAGIISGIFIYSVIINPGTGYYPIKCIHEKLLGSKCSTCGLSHGFSAIVRGRFDDAIRFQSNSMLVFSFFAIQLFSRVIMIFLLLKSQINVRLISNIDILFSVLLFLLTFRNLISQTFTLFAKVVL